MTKVYTIKQCLEGEISIEDRVIVRGWVKTRRDSKAGLSFINLHDGSCFAPIQLVVPNELPNYQDEILKVNTGCSLIATGRLVSSQAKANILRFRSNRLR